MIIIMIRMFLYVGEILWQLLAGPMYSITVCLENFLVSLPAIIPNWGVQNMILKVKKERVTIMKDSVKALRIPVLWIWGYVLRSTIFRFLRIISVSVEIIWCIVSGRNITILQLLIKARILYQKSIRNMPTICCGDMRPVCLLKMTGVYLLPFVSMQGCV